MPEAAAAEREREEEEAAEEARRLAEERAAEAKGVRRRAVVEERRFQWTWAERKSVVDKLSTFGFGQWEAIRAAAKLDDDKTPAHIAAFCRRYVLRASGSLLDDACPHLVVAAHAEPSADELAVPSDEGGAKTLDAVFSEALFTKYVLQRAHDDVSRLELMQPLIDAVHEAGGAEAALEPNAGGWLADRPEVKNVEEHCDLPAPWWSPRDDRALLVGTLRHGWGRWDAIRADRELGLEASWEAAISAANGSPGAAVAAMDADEEPPPSSSRRLKRKRVSMDSASEDSKENSPGNKRRSRGGSASSPTSDKQVKAPGEVVMAVEWPLNRVLSLRVRRLCAALGGKMAVVPPPPKAPRVPKAPSERASRGPRGNPGAGNLDKIQRAKLQIEKLPRDEEGRVVLPVGPVQGVTLECLGVVQPPDKVGYHSAAYVLPVGYRTTRQYMRCDDPNGPRTRWVQEIIEGDAGPAFRLTADEGMDEPIVAKSATAAWAEVLRRVTAARAANGEEAKKTAISGPEFFGYSLPHIRLLVEELPGVSACADYQRLMEREIAAPPALEANITEASD